MPTKLNKTSLISQIKLANAAYAQGVPYLSDDEYHELWLQLRMLEPNNPELYHTTKDPNLQPGTYPHKYPIRAIQKAMDMSDMKVFLSRFGSDKLIVMPKYDGVGAVIYEQAPYAPYPYRLMLFGDGKTGRDITHHLPNIQFNMMGKSFQNVELIILKKDFQLSYGKNPRNTVAGWLNRKEMFPPNVVTAIPHKNGPEQKLIIPPYNLDELFEMFLMLHTQWSQVYPIDGLIIRVADSDKCLRLESSDEFYQYMIAWKPPISTAWTEVTNIEWNVSRTGRVVPTILYNPIELCGTSNQRVTGNNLQWLLDKGIHIGSDILVGKAGEIIPQILKVKSVSEHLVVVPTHCPICHTALERKSLDLICPGTECIPQLSKKLAYFYSDKGMDLKTIGEAMIIQLFEESKALEILNYAPWALLDPLSYDLTRSLVSAWGIKRYENYVQSLQDINGKKNQAQFMAALGYEKLAVKTVVKIFHALKGAKSYSHISAKALNNFVAALRDCDQAIKTMTNFTLLPIPEPPKVTYCITGELSMTRSDMVDYLTPYGWQFTNQVSKFTDYLIVGETKNETTKMRKAKELKVPIIKEDTIAEILKEYTDERTNETDIPS